MPDADPAAQADAPVPSPGVAPDAPGTPPKLKKELGLWDVYAISTGAMFSSGFFLLPGLATANAGPSTVLAYLLAGVLMIPAMLSMSELSTALPRAGGTYFFLDRSLGPAAGTVGGLGTWLALVLKSAFALLGMGAYLAIAPGVASLLPGDPDQQLWIIKALAVALTVAFAALNIFGAKETTRLQGILVIALLSVLAFFLVQGLWYVFFRLPDGELTQQYTPFFHRENGLAGFMATVGLVFVSYAGLTKVASVSEEVKDPDRNLPLGMILSLITATTIYVLGVAIMIATVDAGPLRGDYTPVATSADRFFNWLPWSLGLVLIVVSALAAFASTGNAGILAASRYPLAMGRDRLLPQAFCELGRFGTPTLGILTTAGMMIAFILLLSAEGVAKVASAFNLFVFALMNVSVIVMRESRIESYDPGFRSPLYPWMQLAGVGIALVLIYQMGSVAVGASAVLAALGAIWYWYYAREQVIRDGAIYHVFSRLGRRQFDGLDTEFRQIIKEKGLRDEDPFDDVVARAGFVEAQDGATYEQLVDRAASWLATRIGQPTERVRARFADPQQDNDMLISRHALLPHFRAPGIERPELLLVRCVQGLEVATGSAEKAEQQAPIDADRVRSLEAPADDQSSARLQRRSEEQRERERRAPSHVRVHAMFFLVSPQDDPGLHLRVLAQIATQLERDGFIDRWLYAPNEQRVKEVLLQDDNHMALRLLPNRAAASLIGRTLAQIDWPQDVLVSLINRRGRVFPPRGNTTLREHDRLTIIGSQEGIAKLREQLGLRPRPGASPSEPKLIDKLKAKAKAEPRPGPEA